jgi:hypothetical protein
MISWLLLAFCRSAWPTSMSYHSGAWPRFHSVFIAFQCYFWIMRRVREARLEWKGRERALLRLHSRGKVRDQKELGKVTCRRSWIARGGRKRKGDHRREPSPELIRSKNNLYRSYRQLRYLPSTVEGLSIYPG